MVIIGTADKTHTKACGEGRSTTADARKFMADAIPGCYISNRYVIHTTRPVDRFTRLLSGKLPWDMCGQSVTHDSRLCADLRPRLKVALIVSINGHRIFKIVQCPSSRGHISPSKLLMPRGVCIDHPAVGGSICDRWSACTWSALAVGEVWDVRPGGRPLKENSRWRSGA